MKQNFHVMSVEAIYKELNATEKGLSTKESNKRLKEYGENVLPSKKADSIFKIFFHELCDPIVILLIAAIIASFIANEVIDAVAIIFIVLVDLIMGTYQENKANNVAAALSKLVAVKTKVLRDGKEVTIDSKDLVVGDYVFLESGDKISADFRIIFVINSGYLPIIGSIPWAKMITFLKQIFANKIIKSFKIRNKEEIW